MDQETNKIDNQPFYNDNGQINNPSDAWDIAHAENTALLVEEKLREQHETGLTEGERANVEVMDTLREIYPHAFKEFVDKNGETAIQTGMWGIEEQGMFTAIIRGNGDETIKLYGSISDERLKFLKENLVNLKHEVAQNVNELFEGLLFHGGAVLFSKYGADIVNYLDLYKDDIVLQDRSYKFGAPKKPLPVPESLEKLDDSEKELFKKIMSFINTHNELLEKEKEEKKKQVSRLDWLKS